MCALDENQVAQRRLRRCNRHMCLIKVNMTEISGRHFEQSDSVFSVMSDDGCGACAGYISLCMDNIYIFSCCCYYLLVFGGFLCTIYVIKAA